MIKASLYDRTLIVALLSASFDDNLSVNYIIQQGEGRKRHIRALMDYSFEICLMFGEVWLSADKNACALVLYPDRKRVTLKSIWLDIKLIWNSVGIKGISKVLNREALIKNKQPEMPMYYLWFIGVNPLSQHNGAGSKLLTTLLERAKGQGRPVFLETSALKNLPWYKRFGFSIYDQLELDYTLFFLNNIPA